MGPSSKVHVTNGTIGDHETRQHLGQVVGSNTVTESRQQNGALPDELVCFQYGGGQRTYDRCNDDTNDQGNNVCPGRKSEVLLDNHNKTEDEGEDEHGNVPPPRRFLVVLGHMSMVTIVVSAGSGAFVGTGDILAPEEEAVGNQSTNL